MALEQVIVLQSWSYAGATGVTDLVSDTVRMPYSGKIKAVHFYVGYLNDANNSALYDVTKNGASVLTGAVDPITSNTLTAGVLKQDGSANFVAGDLIQFRVTVESVDVSNQASCSILVEMYDMLGGSIGESVNTANPLITVRTFVNGTVRKDFNNP